MKKIYFLKLLLLLFVFSCENELVELNDQQSEIANDDAFKATLVDGRFHFHNVEDVKTSVDYIKTLSDEAIESLMYKFYEQGFEPLYPFYNENDEIRIAEFVVKKQKRNDSRNVQYKVATESDDDLSDIEIDDDLIGDDNFAGVLNFEREVVVNGKLHKYTHEGVFRVDLDKKNQLYTYIVQNNINELNIPDPNMLTRGLIQLTPTIERFAPEYVSGGCGNEQYQPNELIMHYNDFVEGGCGGSGGGYGGGGSSSPPTDHTASLKNYLKDLMPCDYQNGGVFGWNPFGTSKKCFSYHSNEHRVKTKYWNENLLVYNSIGVKVKHQRKHSALFATWWAAKTTDEVAVVINQAIFTTTAPDQIPNYSGFPTASSAQNRLFFYGGKYYASPQSAISVLQGWSPPSGIVPTTPFQDDIIVQEYIDLPILRNINDIEIEAKEINKLFWEKGVWEGAKSIFQGLTGEQPVRVTYLVTTPQKVYIHYVDLTHRKLNDKKIVKTLDYDWGGQVKFTLKFGSNGDPTANLSEWIDENWCCYNPAGNVWDNVSSSVSFKKTGLTEFETISMDFVGLTRHGNTWKGSRILYQKD